MGFFTNIINGMANYNRVVEESGKSRSILGSYAKVHVGPAEKAILGAVIFTTVLVVIKSAVSGNQQMQNSFDDNRQRNRNNYRPQRRENNNYRNRSEILLEEGSRKSSGNINYRHA